MTGPAGPVRIVVERLVLDGIEPAPGEVDAIVNGLTSELHRLVVERLARPGSSLYGAGTTPAAGATDVRVAGIALSQQTPAAEIGRRIGAGVHAAVDGGVT